MRRRSTLAILVLLAGCSPPTPPEATYKPTQAELAHDRDHAFDGTYLGTGMVAPGYYCSAAPGQFTSRLTVEGSRFELTPLTNDGGPIRYHGNVSPGGVLTRYGVLIGRIADGHFSGGITLYGSCRHLFEMTRQTSG